MNGQPRHRIDHLLVKLRRPFRRRKTVLGQDPEVVQIDCLVKAFAGGVKIDDLHAGDTLTKDGILIIKAQTHRTQERNRQEALQRLIEFIQRAAEKPKVRLATKPTRASQKRRLETKRQHSVKKQLRRSVMDE